MLSGKLSGFWKLMLQKKRKHPPKSVVMREVQLGD